MQVIDSQSYEDMLVGNIVVISAVRSAGRTSDFRTCGRSIHGFLYLWSGEATFWIGERKLVLGERELLYIPKHSRYKMQYSAPETNYVLINFSLFDKDGCDRSLSHNIEVLAAGDSTSRIANILRNLELFATAQTLSAFLRRKELFYKLLGVLYENSPSLSLPQRKYPQILAGVLLLEQTYLENLPVSRFAETSNVSISLFRSLFSKQYGMSPIQYRNRLRITRAAEILSEGSCTISEAAYACGFENIGYFCRYYKKITGETPLETKRRSL